MAMSDRDKVTVYKWVIGGYVALRIAKIAAEVIKYKSYNDTYVNETAEEALEINPNAFKTSTI
jgi:hypothetical protein